MSSCTDRLNESLYNFRERDDRSLGKDVVRVACWPWRPEEWFESLEPRLVNNFLKIQQMKKMCPKTKPTTY